MRKAFTMIELIFVIIIIGIISAIAIPKLSATRDDALQASLVANTRICVYDIVAGYTATEIEPVLNDLDSCVNANNALSGAVTLNSPNIIVTGVSHVLNGQHRYKGTAVQID